MIRYCYVFLFGLFVTYGRASVTDVPRLSGDDIHVTVTPASKGKYMMNVKLNSFFSMRFPLQANRKEVVQELSSPDKLGFTYQHPGKWFYLEINCHRTDNGKRTRIPGSGFYAKQRYFLLEKGDQVFIEADDNGVSFMGAAADKLNIQRDLMLLEDSLSRPLSVSESGYLEVLKQRMQQFQNVAERQLKYLGENRSRLAEPFYDELVRLVLGRRNYCFINEISLAIVTGWPVNSEEKYEFNNAVYRLYRECLSGFGGYPGEPSEYDTYQADFLMVQTLLDLSMRKYANTRIREKINTESLLYEITTAFSGSIRRRLLVMGAVYLYRQPGYDLTDYFSAAGRYITKGTYEALLFETLAMRSARAPAFEFDLPDTSGNRVTLSDFKGYVVVLKFWFTGCVPCAMQKEAMEPIVKAYKDLPVKFVSINIDRKIQVWKSSGLPSGKYSHKGAVDLYTEGQGWSHPMMLNYNFNSVPQLVVVDKYGYIVTTNPPKLTTEQGRKTFKEILNSELQR